MGSVACLASAEIFALLLFWICNSLQHKLHIVKVFVARKQALQFMASEARERARQRRSVSFRVRLSRDFSRLP